MPKSKELGEVSSPDGIGMQKISINIGGKKVTIEHDNPAIEAEMAARLLGMCTPEPVKSKAVADTKDVQPSLARLIRDFVTEKKLTEGWTPKTIDENEAIFQLLKEALKNPSVATIGMKQATDFKNILLRLPPNRTKGENAGKSVHVLAATKHQRTMSNSTVNKYLRRISSLFAWGVKHGIAHENPFKDLGIKETRRRHTLRDRFYIEELKQLFSPRHHNKSSMKHSYGYWLPWLGLYTGARLEELCQLHLADIRKEGETWVLDINDKDGKRLKTAASERLIPLHSRLITIGFLDHADILRQQGETRLFPELKQMRDGYSQAASKWFGRHRLSIGIEKPFHSLRHTFVDELRQLDSDHKKIAALVGHTDETMTGGTYGNPFRADVLKPVVELLTFDF